MEAFLAQCRALCSGVEAPDDPVRLAVLASIVHRLVDARTEDIPLLAHRRADVVVPELPSRDPEVLVAACEATQPRSGRRASGAFYTPPHVARAIARQVLDRVEADTPAVCDPAAGAGAFLLAVGRLLMERGVPARGAVPNLVGVDLDPVALLCADAALRVLAAGAAAPVLLHADALLGVDWAAFAPEGFDAVVGNPPFLNQLETATVRRDAAALKATYGDVAGGYADTAAVFFALALRLTRSGGAFGMIAPESILATRDARPLRTLLAENASLAWVWRSVENVFEAGVQVCAPVFVHVPPTGSLRVDRSAGAEVEPIEPMLAEPSEFAAQPTWSWLFADTRGVPAFAVASAETLAAWCTATADFRDQYYGLIPYVREGTGGPAERRLVTVGLIDPARLLWGVRSTRFAKTAYARPVIDLDALLADPGLGAWARARLTPKLLLSTQTRVLEVLADPAGDLLPSIPTITVQCAEQDIWRVGAALSSPVLSAWALRHFAGAALSTDAIKLSAKQVLALPAPAPGQAWDRGAEAYRAASAATCAKEWADALAELARGMCDAYGLSAAEGEAVTAWWTARLPAWVE